MARPELCDLTSETIVRRSRFQIQISTQCVSIRSPLSSAKLVCLFSACNQRYTRCKLLVTTRLPPRPVRGSIWDAKTARLSEACEKNSLGIKLAPPVVHFHSGD